VPGSAAAAFAVAFGALSLACGLVFLLGRIRIPAFDIGDTGLQFFAEAVSAELSFVLIHFGGDEDLSCQSPGDVTPLPIRCLPEVWVLVDHTVFRRVLA